MDARTAEKKTQSRRALFAERVAAETGVDETLISAQVRAFYAKARGDPLLGPVFERMVFDWEAHFGRMDAFWSSVLLMRGSYHGSPMARHQVLPIGADHFDRWLALWDETAREVCPAPAAELFATRARAIGESLELGIAASRGVLLGKGERLEMPHPTD
ncbi:MAG: group III truncated hemoglobin [Caulobacteraceae bacterium]